MDLEPAGPEAHAAVLALHHENGWMDDEVFGELWVARDGDEIVGAVELVDASEHRVALLVAIVRADRRGSGIGSDLLRAALASRDGEWWTECRSERIPFYERLGFEGAVRADLPDDVRPLIDHPSTTQPDRGLNFMRRSARVSP